MCGGVAVAVQVALDICNAVVVVVVAAVVIPLLALLLLLLPSLLRLSCI